MAPPMPELLENWSSVQRRLHGSETMLRYLGQLAIPLHLCADYRDYLNLSGPSIREPLVIVSLIAWPVLAALVVWLARRREFLILFGILWFSISLLPASNLIITIGTPRADRLLFLPSLGLVFILAEIIGRTGRVWKAMPVILLTVILAGYGWRTVGRNAEWRSDKTLWTATMRDNPGCAYAWRNLGDIFKEEGDDETAEAYLKKAVELRDGAGFFFSEAHIHLGHIYRLRGDSDAAAAEYRSVVEQRPNHVIGLISAGQILSRRSETLPVAIEYLDRASRINPANFHTHANLANALYRNGQYEAALSAVDKALELNKDQAYVWSIRGKTLNRLDRKDEAAQANQKAKQLQDQ
jgi:Tfp pilus assembly protein PilF